MLANKIYLDDGSWLKVTIIYSLGGWQSKRGYYLSVIRQEKSNVSGCVQTNIFDPANKTILLKEVTRKSKKAEIEAENIAREKFSQYMTA
jgi:hypothetical protein